MKAYTYVMSDIHGQYDAFIKMLKKINFNELDTLYILGDAIDRGPKSIDTLFHIMECKNMILLAGNHEYMAALTLNYLLQDITNETIDKLTDGMVFGLLNEWQINGGSTTLNEIIKLDKNTRNKIFNYLIRLKLHKELSLNDSTFVLVHAGLGNFKKDKKHKDYTILELTSERIDYDKEYFNNKILITGHTPTQTIEGNPRPGYIYKNKNNINIDCGCSFGGKLGCLRLDDMREYYVNISC